MPTTLSPPTAHASTQAVAAIAGQACTGMASGEQDGAASTSHPVRGSGWRSRTMYRPLSAAGRQAGRPTGCRAPTPWLAGLMGSARGRHQASVSRVKRRSRAVLNLQDRSTSTVRRGFRVLQPLR